MSPEDLAFKAFRCGWESAITRCGGFVPVYRGSMQPDWQAIREEEFKAFWIEENKVWELEAEMEQQRVAQRLAAQKPLNVMPIPHAVPEDIYDELGRIKIGGMEVE